MILRLLENVLIRLLLNVLTYSRNAIQEQGFDCLIVTLFKPYSTSLQSTPINRDVDRRVLPKFQILSLGQYSTAEF